MNDWLTAGLGYHQAGQLSEAEAVYSKILEIDPEQADALHLSGLIAHQLGRPDRAVSLIRRAIGIDPSQPFYHNNLGNAVKEKNDFDAAAKCYIRAIELNPEYAEAYFNLADILQVQNQYESAKENYKKALMLKPDLTVAALHLGHIYRKLGEFKKAVYWYESVARLYPEDLDACYYMGAVYVEQQKYNKAVSCLKKVLSIDPNHIDAHFKLGMAHKENGQLDQAVLCYQNALRLQPDLAEACNNLGLVYKLKQQLAEASACFQKALKVNPQLYEAHNNLGNVLCRTGRKEESILSFKKALQINPDYGEAWINMGDSYLDLEDFKEAVACYQRAIEIDPENAPAYYHAGHVFEKQGNTEDSIRCFQRAMEIDPSLDMGYSYLTKGLMQICDWERIKDLNGSLSQLKKGAEHKEEAFAEHPFVSIITHADPAFNLIAAKARSDRISAAVSELNVHFQPYACDKRPGKEKISIGYYSGNFRDHANAHQIHGMFECHSRKDFEIFCYSNGKDDGSLYYEKIRRDCDAFVDIRNLSDVEAARRIHQDQVDILVDLAGPIEGGRPKIFALRPAPVQIRYLGMPGTSGADFYDYLITDPIVTPDADAPFYTEKFIRMPHCYQVNSTQPPSKRKRTRKDFGLPEEGFIFCSFNTSYKFDEIMFHAWMQILQDTPETVLWLLSQNRAAEANLRVQAESCGVDSNRIIFAEKMPKPEHLSRLELPDLALDTRIVNGAASTSDVLRMGLPMITLEGTHFASRMSASILTAMGLPELITRDLESYKKLAVRLTHPEALDSIRSKLKKNRKTSPLFDTARFVKNLETAFRDAWKIYQDKKPPRQIEVREFLKPS